MLAYSPGLAFWSLDLSTSAGHDSAVASAPEKSPDMSCSGKPPSPHGCMTGSSRCFAWGRRRSTVRRVQFKQREVGEVRAR